MSSESKKTVSRCTTEVARGTHAFEIVGYSLKKGIGVGNFIQSGTFTVGSYDWAIRFYPDGRAAPVSEYVSVYLELMSKDAEVRALYDLSLVNRGTGLPEVICAETISRVFCSSNDSRYGPQTPKFIARNRLEMESSGFIADDYLTIECNVTVLKDSQVLVKTTEIFQINVPPPDLLEHFSKLFEEKETADVTFFVGGETFPAHKLVLATRSPVFKAELYGQMMEGTAQCVTVEDMQPDVFKALLHFIYTDSLPKWNDPNDDEYSEIIRHLLVAADRYAMDRLKLMCASILVKYLDVETVATTLALADQHNCQRLKDVCMEFMASSDEMDALVATQGYANLKRTCPSILVDVLERTSKYYRVYVE